MAGRDGRPDRAKELFEFLFDQGDDQALERLSSGVVAMLDNADGLIDDAAVLVEAKRYDRAEFLVATAQEEMGKAYMLLDMCRVNFIHQHVLRPLCSSFYSHVLKHAYFDLSANNYPGIRDLHDVQHYFRINAREWWPSSPESGEPDMPHDTFFLREANLYVDIDTYSDTWMEPCRPSKAMRFDEALFINPLDKAREALQALRATQGAGLFQPVALSVFNNAMKRLVVCESTSMDQLLSTYEQAGSRLQADLGIAITTFQDSALNNWPLYWVRR